MKKLGRFVRNNSKLFIGILIGAVIFGGSATIIAGTVASSAITYTNNGQSNVQGALNNLYNKVDYKLQEANNIADAYKSGYSGYVYWNDYSDSNTYASGNTPSKVLPYLSHTDGNNQPFIGTNYTNGTPGEHSVCFGIFSTKKWFCFDKNFRQSLSNVTTMDELLAAMNTFKPSMEEAFETTATVSKVFSNEYKYSFGSSDYCTVKFNSVQRNFGGLVCSFSQGSCWGDSVTFSCRDTESAPIPIGANECKVQNGVASCYVN